MGTDSTNTEITPGITSDPDRKFLVGFAVFALVVEAGMILGLNWAV